MAPKARKTISTKVWSQRAHFCVYHRPQGIYADLTSKLQREQTTGTPPFCFPIPWDSTPFALPLLLPLVSVSVSIRWVIGLSRLVGVASGGSSRGWRHVWIGHRSYVASIDAKPGSVRGVSCVWRLFVAVSCGGEPSRGSEILVFGPFCGVIDREDRKL